MIKEYKQLHKITDLERGDIVRSVGEKGISYTVDDIHGERAIAVRTVTIENPIEWEVLRTQRRSLPVGDNK